MSWGSACTRIPITPSDAVWLPPLRGAAGLAQQALLHLWPHSSPKDPEVSRCVALEGALPSKKGGALRKHAGDPASFGKRS
jgi:hypothetical protein